MYNNKECFVIILLSCFLSSHYIVASDGKSGKHTTQKKTPPTQCTVSSSGDSERASVFCSKKADCWQKNPCHLHTSIDYEKFFQKKAEEERNQLALLRKNKAAKKSNRVAGDIARNHFSKIFLSLQKQRLGTWCNLCPYEKLKDLAWGEREIMSKNGVTDVGVSHADKDVECSDTLFVRRQDDGSLLKIIQKSSTRFSDASYSLIGDSQGKKEETTFYLSTPSSGLYMHDPATGREYLRIPIKLPELKRGVTRQHIIWISFIQRRHPLNTLKKADCSSIEDRQEEKKNIRFSLSPKPFLKKKKA